MACKYIHNGKTYSEQELIEYLKANPISNTYEVKPDFSNVSEILKQFEVKQPLEDKVAKRLSNLLKNQIEVLRARILVFESAKERKGYLPKEETINKLKDLEEDLSKLEDVDAFIKTAEFIHNELKFTENFLNNNYDINNIQHMEFLLQIRTQLKSYEELKTFLPQIENHRDEIKAMSNDINLLHANISELIEEYLEESMIMLVENESKDTELTKDDIKNILKETKDISWQELRLGGMSNSMDKLLQLIHRKVEKQREEVYERTNSWIDKIKAQAEKLKQAGVEGFNWMFQKDENGKPTGRFLQKVSKVYYEQRSKMFKLLKDEHGNKREYIYKPNEILSDEEKKHNLKLHEDKKKLAEFLSAEDTSTGLPLDGENHKYSDEFKQQRALFEQYVVDENGYGQWIKKPFVPGSTLISGEKLTLQQHDELYKRYRRKYYTQKETFSMISSKKVPTGEVQKTIVTYVKPEYVEVVTEKNGVRTNFGDKEYYDLMNDNSPQGKARKEFFDFYVNTTNELLDKLPLAVKEKMKGKLFRIKNSITKDVKTAGIFSALGKSIRQFVNPDIIFTSREVDEQGNFISDIPILYTGDLKDDSKIKQLEKRLEDYRAELQKNPNNKELIKKIKIAKNSLLIEQNKLNAEDLETDMIKALTKAAHMAENYDLMNTLESTIMIAKNVIDSRRYYNINSAGQKEYVQGESNVQKRYETYLRMIFYSNSTANQTKISKLIQNFNSFVAYKSLGLNPFSAVNNTIMANINNRIEGFGRQFGFTNTHLNAAIKDTTEYIAGMSYMKHLGKDEYLLEPSNKFEAMLKKFNWIDRNQIIEDSSTISKVMFMGITGGEFIAQSNTAIAKLRSQMLTNSKTGEKLSIWEAHEFVDGQLKLKDGFEYSSNERRALSVDIKNMNKIIHGNYSENDKVAMQEHALNQSVMQFKKWVYNFGKSRWGNTYYDESVGDYQEGRYRTFANFISILKAGSMYDFNSIKNAFNSLEDYQKSNLKKLQVEGIYWMTTAVLMLLLESLAEGIDDDDKELKMMVNWLRKQSDRVGGELDAAINPKSISANLKNPVSGLRAAGDFGDLFVQLLKTPLNYAFGDEKDIYIQKGSNKGMTKLGKEFRDLVPVANLESQFDNLLTSGNFYFK